MSNVDGTVLAHAGWQNACTLFHRANSETCHRCVESDTSLVESLTGGSTYATYRCLNGLIDTAARIVVEGEHVANVFAGQFLTEPPDLEFFRQQARQYGFDEASYLEAISKVPVLPQERVESITQLYAKIAVMLANNGMDRIKESRAAENLAIQNRGLEERVVERTGELERVNGDLQRREDLLKGILDTSRVGIILFDKEARIVKANQGMSEMFGYSLDDLAGKEYLTLVKPSELNQAKRNLKKILANDVSTFDIERLYLRADRTEFWGHLAVKTFCDSNGEQVGFVAVIYDINERKQMEDQVRQMAFHDTLTNLPNRRLLSDRLIQTIAASKRNGCYGALIYLDLDNFKPLNDMYGHNAGDLLLIEVAQRLRGCVRGMDTVARFGGDEFVVLLSQLNISKAKSTLQANIVAEKIRNKLSEPYLLTIKRDGESDATIRHYCTASIGVALFVNHETCLDDVLKWADMAMYQAKETGPNLIRFHDSKV